MFASIFKLALTILALSLVLFTGSLVSQTKSSTDSILQQTAAVLRVSQTQWVIFLCLLTYLGVLVFLRGRRNSGVRRRTEGLGLWLVSGLAVSVLHYAWNYRIASQSTDALTFLAAAVLGEGAAAWAEWQRPKASEAAPLAMVVTAFWILYSAAALWRPGEIQSFRYNGQMRWSGPWDNPNIFGMLMGSGMVLSIGLIVSDLRLEVSDEGSKKKNRGWNPEASRNGVGIFHVAAAFLLARALLHSYSRGAWIASASGLAYLAVQPFRASGRGSEAGRQAPEIRRNPCLSWLTRNWLPFGLGLSSISILVFWHFRQTEWHPARRAFSTVNAVDFSWRNRIVAWEGASQIIAEHPWTGVGWNQPETLYEHYYLPPKFNESAAIEMNDFLMLGSILGIPALFCFGMHVWLNLVQGAKRRVQKDAQDLEMNWLQTTCRAGAIVLLVGFWFDGGLFKLPTAATFCILLELGAIKLPQSNGVPSCGY